MQKKLMNTLVASLGACATLLSFPAGADDIDIFTGASAGAKANPNILIVLDNTSNWSRQAQKWPGGATQGQSEVRAIKSAIAGLDSTVNVGLFEFVTGGNANDNGGYVRFAIQPMTDSAKGLLGTTLDRIDNNITSPSEKRNSGTEYGNLMYDVYNYFGGRNSFSPAATGGSYSPDPAGYSSQWGRYSSPLNAANSCAQTVVVFVTNPDQSGPTSDASANTTTMGSLGGDTAQMKLPNFTSQTVDVPTALGQTNLCYATADAARTELTVAPWPTNCSAYSQGCSIGSALNDGSKICPAGQSSWAIIGTNRETTNVIATTGETNDTHPFNADEWARFMHNKGVPIPGTSPTQYSNVTFYTIDVYNRQQNTEHTSLMLSMARAGGGKYFAAKSQQAILDALKQIIGEIQAVNSTFASTSLPVNSTNRSQNENQVFIGMFRPDPGAKPRWFGNLKRYQLIAQGSDVKLGDNSNPPIPAVNPVTGFVTDCAKSFWTTDNGAYWRNLDMNPDPAGKCDGQDPYSDSPDGPLVEKGAVAQVLRNGNNPPATSATPTYAVNRTIYTRAATGSSLVTFNATNSGLSTDLVNFIKGADVNNERKTGNQTLTRPSIHGDVIHSRPLPLNYGSARGGVTVFYGANDGYFRAVNADTGQERWAFIAPEFFGRLQRLKDQTPLVNYPNLSGPGDVSATGAQKDYFFDGSTGFYQNADSTAVWVFPSMRRGGRMIYGLNVSDVNNPSLMWAAGCPNLGNDTGCSTGLTGIGQTWSTPAVALIKGYSETTPVIVMGGGYDNCEDANTGAPTCTSGKGGYVYVLNASTGALLASFQTRRSVSADVSLIDVDGDGMVDYAYAADLGGSIYRIDFVEGPPPAGGSTTPLAQAAWQMYRVAYTNQATSPRKFMFGPAVLYNKGSVYLALGSGDREHPLGWQYPYTSVQNRFYVALDNLSVKPTTEATSMNLDTALRDSSDPTDCNSPKTLPGGSSKGWFMQLGQGEQVVTSALIAGGTVTFSTNRPIVGAAASCATSLGEARGYMVNLFNASGTLGVDGVCGGNRSSVFPGGGLPPSPTLATAVPITLDDGTVVRRDVEIGSPKGSGPIDATKVGPRIKSERKRKYTYVKGQ